jgi:anti-sigma factor RsiW
MKRMSPRRLRQTCAECREKIRHLRLRGSLEAYVDGELTGSRRAEVAAHLACCWTCSGYAETLRLIKHSLRTGPRRAPVPLAEVRLRRFADRLADRMATASGTCHGTGPGGPGPRFPSRRETGRPAVRTPMRSDPT